MFNLLAQLTPSSEVICGGACPLIDPSFDFSQGGIAGLIITIARILTFTGVALAVLFLVYAGILFIIGKGEEAKKNIITTLTGLVIIIVAYVVVALIANFLQGTSLDGFFSSNNSNF